MQIAKEIFLKSLNIMKKTLDLGEVLFDMRTKQFKYFRAQVMEITYTDLKKLFKYFSDEKILKKCPEKCNLRKGYSKCLCGGSGFINAK